MTPISVAHVERYPLSSAGGLYPIKSFPYILGMEASGTVVALPTDHDDLLKHEEYKARGLRVGSKVAVVRLYPASAV